MTDREAVEACVVQAHDLVVGGALERGSEVLRGFALDGGDADLAAAQVGERLVEGGFLEEAVALLGGRDDIRAPHMLVVRGLARLGLGHYQPSAADLERALSLGVNDTVVRKAAIDGVVAALKALSATRSACPLYSRKAEMWEDRAMAVVQSAPTLERWVQGEWSPGERFGGVVFGEVLPIALLDCVCVLPDDEEERWSFHPPSHIVISTDEGRLDLVNTWESVRYQNTDLIGLSRRELEAALGPADAEQWVASMLYMSYDSLDIDVVLEDEVVTHAVVTGDGLSTV